LAIIGFQREKFLGKARQCEALSDASALLLSFAGIGGDELYRPDGRATRRVLGRFQMTDLAHQKIEQSIHDRKHLHTAFLKNVKTYKSFLEVEEKAFQDGTLSRKTKELMALSISIVTKCEPCMEWHLDQALKAGATDDEVYETIDVAIEMGGGQAGAYARFVLKAMEFFRGKR